MIGHADNKAKELPKKYQKYNLVESYFEYFCPFYYLDLHSLSLIFALWWSFPISFLTEKYFDFPLTIFNDFGT